MAYRLSVFIHAYTPTAMTILAFDGLRRYFLGVSRKSRPSSVRM